MKTKAAIAYEVKQPVVVEEIEVHPPRENEVMVKIAASGVCHSDLSLLNGTIVHTLPEVLGHEGSGTVVEVGKGVTDYQEGDQVMTLLCRSLRELPPLQGGARDPLRDLFLRRSRPSSRWDLPISQGRSGDSPVRQTRHHVRIHRRPHRRRPAPAGGLPGQDRRSHGMLRAHRSRGRTTGRPSRCRRERLRYWLWRGRFECRAGRSPGRGPSHSGNRPGRE